MEVKQTSTTISWSSKKGHIKWFVNRELKVDFSKIFRGIDTIVYFLYDPQTYGRKIISQLAQDVKTISIQRP